MPERRRKVWVHPRLITEHAFDKLRLIDCSLAELDELLQGAEVLEDHELATGSVKELLLLVEWKRPLHVVVVVDGTRQEERIVTVYEPSAEHWRPGYRERR